MKSGQFVSMGDERVKDGICSSIGILVYKRKKNGDTIQGPDLRLDNGLCEISSKEKKDRTNNI